MTTRDCSEREPSTDPAADDHGTGATECDAPFCKCVGKVCDSYPPSGATEAHSEPERGDEDRVREYAEALRSVAGGGEGFWTDEARAVLVVADEEMAEKDREIERLRAQLDTMTAVAQRWEREANEAKGNAL